MTKFFSLVKLLFVSQFRVKPSTTGKKSKGGAIALWIIIAISFSPMFVGVAIVSYGLGGLVPSDKTVVTFMMLLAQGVTLMFGFASVIANVYNGKDADRLLYLPMSSQQIFFAKLFVAYVNEAAISTLIILTTLLPYGIASAAGVGYFATLVIAIVLVPLLPMLLSSLVAMPICLLMAKIGKNGVVKNILQILLFVAVMLGYMAIVQNLGASGDTTPDIAVILSQWLDKVQAVTPYMHPNYPLASALVSADFVTWLLQFALTVAEFAVLAAALYAVSKPFYNKIMSLSLETSFGKRKSATNADYDAKPTSVFKELIVTDMKRVLRDSQMGFQSLVGLVMVPVVIIFLSIGFQQGSTENPSEPTLISMYPVIVTLGIMCYLILLTAGTNVLGLFPVSRENKSFYLIKTLPVPFEVYLQSKVVLATVVMLVVDLLSAICAMIFFGVDVLSGLGMMIVLALVGYGEMCITTLADVKEPKLGWTNFQQSLKNTKNSLIAFLVGIAAAVVIGGIGALFTLWLVKTNQNYVQILMWATLFVVGGVFAFVCNKIMRDNARRFFERIEP